MGLSATNTLTGGSLGGTNMYGSQPTVRAAATVQTAPRGKPKRHGWFQYGHNQWGYMNAGGNVDWKAKQPKPNQGRVLNWNNVRGYLKATGGLSGMPKAAGQTAAWLDNDPIYKTKLSEYIAQRDQNLNAFQRQRADYQDEYKQGLSRLDSSFQGESQKMLASLAARGFGGSGVESKSYGDLTRDRAAGEADLALQRGPRQWERLADDAQSERQLYAIRKLNETMMAKERYAAEHGKKPVGFKTGFWKNGSTWFYTNKDGVTVSIGNRRPRQRGGA